MLAKVWNSGIFAGAAICGQDAKGSRYEFCIKLGECTLDGEGDTFRVRV